MKDLIDSIKEDEGFIGNEYKDSLGRSTVGYGTLLPLTEAEATKLLKSRLDDKISGVLENHPFVENLPKNKQQVIYEMAYQLGVGGLNKFKKMWSALKSGDFQEASKEMLDSRWAKQTPNRARKLADIMAQNAHK